MMFRDPGPRFGDSFFAGFCLSDIVAVPIYAFVVLAPFHLCSSP